MAFVQITLIGQPGFAISALICVASSYAFAEAKQVGILDAENSKPSSPERCTKGFLPALTAVTLRTSEDLGSKISKPGQKFHFSLEKPVIVNGCIALPAGIVGEGEVIHAKKASFMGAGGEFIAVSRFLTINGFLIKLRSLQMRASGSDDIRSATIIPGGGVIVFRQRGKGPRDLFFPKGTVVVAMTANDVDIGDFSRV